MESTVFRRPQISSILSEFVFVDLHLDGAPEKISSELRSKQAELALLLAKSSAMPQYVVLNPHDLQVIGVWGWENADPKKWESKLEDALNRWKNLRK